MKFSVGDKVRVISKQFGGYEGHVGVITVVNEDAMFYPYSISECDLAWCDAELELVAPVAPRFKVGDRVRLKSQTKGNAKYRKVGDVGEVVRLLDGAYDCDIYVKFETPSIYGFYDSPYSADDFELAPAPYTPRHVFAASQASHIDDETIDRWVDEGVKNVEAQKTLNFEHPSFTTKSGDALVVVENGKAYLYRLEGTTDVE